MENCDEPDVSNTIEEISGQSTQRDQSDIYLPPSCRNRTYNFGETQLDINNSEFVSPVYSNCVSSISPYYVSPSSWTSSLSSPITPSYYQKLPKSKETYLAYVVAVRDPLNLHLDMYWPEHLAGRYKSAIHYNYTFISEELGSNLYTRPAYSCHLRGVEIIPNDPNDFTNMKEAYILVSKRILRSGGWVLVSVTDIDVYRRVLVNVFDVITRKSINQELLKKISERTGEQIAREYTRPIKDKFMFNPSEEIPKDYHIVFSTGL